MLKIQLYGCYSVRVIAYWTGPDERLTRAEPDNQQRLNFQKLTSSV